MLSLLSLLLLLFLPDAFLLFRESRLLFRESRLLFRESLLLHQFLYARLLVRESL